MGFPRRLSIHRGSEIKQILEKGRPFSAGSLKFYLLPVDSDRLSRLAFIVPRYIHTIVERNLLKRRLQELARLHQLPERGFQAAIRVYPAGYEDSFRVLEKKFIEVAQKINTGTIRS